MHWDCPIKLYKVFVGFWFAEAALLFLSFTTLHVEPLSYKIAILVNN